MLETHSHIFIVSDGTGVSCERMVKAALTQFDNPAVVLHIRNYVRTPAEVEKILREAKDVEGLVVYTLVCLDERQRMQEASKELEVKTLDLFSSLLKSLAEFLDNNPAEIPGLYQDLVD